jgi:large subunit ribosomal protein L23
MNKHIILKPIISEKADILANSKNQYTFAVDKKANKIEIQKALEEMFPDVTIESVNTLIMPKKKKSRNTRSGVLKGATGGHKKAVVTVAEGDELDIYEQN